MHDNSNYIIAIVCIAALIMFGMIAKGNDVSHAAKITRSNVSQCEDGLLFEYTVNGIENSVIVQDEKALTEYKAWISQYARF